MNSEIWKYPLDLMALEPNSSILVKLPYGADVLYATTQQENVVVYAHINPFESRADQVRFWVYGTGQPTYHLPHAKPLGICALRGGAFHIFMDTES